MIGSRAEVFHGTADMTAGGLSKKDLKMKDGRIVSKAASEAALKRMKDGLQEAHQENVDVK